MNRGAIIMNAGGTGLAIFGLRVGSVQSTKSKAVFATHESRVQELKMNLVFMITYYNVLNRYN